MGTRRKPEACYYKCTGRGCGQEGLCEVGDVPFPSPVFPFSPPLLELGVPLPPAAGDAGTPGTIAAPCLGQPPAPSSAVHLFLQEHIYFSRSWLLLQQPKRGGVCTTSHARLPSTSPACICVRTLGCHRREGLQLRAQSPLCITWAFAQANSTGVFSWEYLLFPNKGLLSPKQTGVAGAC